MADIIGDGNNNTLIGEPEDDFIDGKGGNDTLFGRDGNDELFGRNGKDLLNGENGDDTLNGGSGNDTLNGGAGIDLLNGGTGDDKLNSGFGGGTLNGGDGNDTLNGGDSNYNGFTTLDGGTGNDVLIGAIDCLFNYMYGRAGNDTLTSGVGGYNYLYAGDGNDSLRSRSDTYEHYLFGEAGNDRLVGGRNNSLTGGSGVDKFVYDTGAAFTTGAGSTDNITDFSHDVDKIVLDKTIFTTISGFSIADGEFQVVDSDAAAETSTADIVYNSVNGSLFYNQDGSAMGFGSGGQFVTLDGAPVLSATDFIIQA